MTRFIDKNQDPIGVRFSKICARFFHGNVGEFSEKCGVEATNMSKILNGKKEPKVDTIRVLQALPQISARWLLFGTGTMLEGAQPPTVEQNNSHIVGVNLSPNGTYNGLPPEVIDLLRRKDEQISKLLNMLETKNKEQ